LQTANFRLQIGVGHKAELIVVGWLLIFLNGATNAAAFSFDDIVLWYGSGASRAAMVVDWSDTSTEPQALAWGYRWDGTATGADMLAAIVAGDPRLFAKIGLDEDKNIAALFGFGYDADADRAFTLRPQDETEFDADGFAVSGPADGGASNDLDDYYYEGWFRGFWHYSVSPANPYDGGSWSDTASGIQARELTDSAWDSWTFSPTFNFNAYAQNPRSALPYPGDFNSDGDVDAFDYSAWRSAFGSSQPEVDGNGSGVVDAADYVVWRMNLSVETGKATSVTSVPEISTASSCLVLMCLVSLFRRTNSHRPSFHFCGIRLAKIWV
jgi:hypothetical protein